jgi:hypothetical protein
MSVLDSWALGSAYNREELHLNLPRAEDVLFHQDVPTAAAQWAKMVDMEEGLSALPVETD